MGFSDGYWLLQQHNDSYHKGEVIMEFLEGQKNDFEVLIWS